MQKRACDVNGASQANHEPPDVWQNQAPPSELVTFYSAQYIRKTVEKTKKATTLCNVYIMPIYISFSCSEFSGLCCNLIGGICSRKAVELYV